MILHRGIAVLVLVCAAACTRGAPSAIAQHASLDNPGSSSDGGRIYLTNCSSCHQSDGRGVPGAFPALAGNPRVTGDPRRVIFAVKFGLRSRPASGVVGGVMPGWQGLLSDGDIANVVTYIRFAWRNDAAPVSEAQVRVMATPLGNTR